MLLKKGSKGEDVKVLQAFLKSLGYKLTYIDGDFGKETLAAVKAYQKANKLEQDGIVGPKTLAQLQKDGISFVKDRGAAVDPKLVKAFRDSLIKHARKYEGWVEKKSNAQFDDPKKPGWQQEESDLLVKYMSRIRGWSSGAPYCAAAVGAFVLWALEENKLPTEKFIKLWTAHVMTNVAFLKSKGILSVLPSVGSVWLAKMGNTSSGHCGIVIDIKVDNLVTIEANTSTGPTSDPNLQRAGDGIYRRQFNKAGRGTLKTQGFLSAENLLKTFVV